MSDNFPIIFACLFFAIVGTCEGWDWNDLIPRVRDSRNRTKVFQPVIFLDCGEGDERDIDFRHLRLGDNGVEGRLLVNRDIKSPFYFEAKTITNRGAKKLKRDFWGHNMDLCKHLNDEQISFAALFAQANSTCPISSGEYKIKNLRLSHHYYKNKMEDLSFTTLVGFKGNACLRYRFEKAPKTWKD